MNQQFFYTEGTGENAQQGSFALAKVIRSIEYEKGKLAILLDDFHSFTQVIDKPVGKNGKVIKEKHTEVVHSTIYMNEEDSARFQELTEVKVLGIHKAPKPQVVNFTNATETAKGEVTLDEMTK